jgi:CHASE2 domain-containing sensor protein
MKIGKMELYRLGPSSLDWTKYPRRIINLAQEFFKTAWILPFAVIGIIGMWRAGKGRYLLMILAIPVYYVCAQSFLHTEYRYVMAIQHSLFVCVAVAFYLIGCLLKALVRRDASDVARTSV